MANSTDSRIGVARGYAHGQSGASVAEGLNNNFRLQSALLQCSITSSTVSAPPATPNDGDAYMVPTGATGAWAGQIGKLVQWDASLNAWFAVVIKKGFVVWFDDLEQLRVYTSTGWKTLAFAV